MARRLFIPGTGGSLFQDDSGKAIGTILDLALDRQRAFLCEHDPDPDVLAPIRTTGLTKPDGRAVNAHAVAPVRAVHTPFFDQVRPASTRKVYTFFNYDWRLDLRFNGERLWESLRTSGPREPWDIVCHSQGGFLVLWASLLAGPIEFSKFVRRVVFLAVPLQGSVNAAHALINGFDLVPGVRADTATVRSWPSVYMMMPRWRLMVPGATGVEVFKESTWRRANLVADGPALGAGISRALLARAQAWKRELDTQPFDAMQTLQRFVVVQGDNHNTWARAPEFPRLRDLAAARDGEVVVRGDGLVPMDITLQLLPAALKAKLDSIVVKVPSHTAMCTDQDLANLCERIFSS
jgi:hypothetical protein